MLQLVQGMGNRIDLQKIERIITITSNRKYIMGYWFIIIIFMRGESVTREFISTTSNIVIGAGTSNLFEHAKVKHANCKEIQAIG